MKFAVLTSMLVAASQQEEVKGFYSWNWGSGSYGPPGANAGVAFTGLIDIPNAIA